MISFYDFQNDNYADTVDFSTARTVDFRRVLNHDSTPRYKRTNNNFQEQTPAQSANTVQSVDLYNRLIKAITPLLGEKYSNSKRLQKGFSDCSGFVNKVYKQLGIDLKGAASSQLWQMGYKIDLNNIRPGDLAFLTTTSNRNVAGSTRRPNKDTSHVAIVLERQGTKIKVAESTGSQGTVTQWWEIGDPTKKEFGVINYANGSGRKDTFFGFRRLIT